MSHARVLLTTDVVGGVWDFALTLGRSLVPLGYELTLLCIGEPSPAQRSAAADARLDVLSAPLRLEWMAGGMDDIAAVHQMVTQTARRMRADIVHANEFGTLSAPLALPSVLTLHSDVLSWRAWTLGHQTVPDEWRAYAGLVRRAVQSADSVIAVSRFQADQVSRAYATDRPIGVIHNGWDAAARQPASGVRTGTLLAGRIWDAAKNIALAAEAARGWDAGPVLVAGAQEHPDGGQAELPDGLTPLGYLTRHELDAHLATSAVYISPAKYDPFGLLPLQAALHGCALVLSDLPSYREVWGDAALYFPTNHAAALRSVWQRILASADLRGELAQRAYARAHRFTAARMATSYAELYRRVAGRVAA
ncbi:MAG: glycosyltransferase family 4 protein [Chloroflexota bacterium]